MRISDWSSDVCSSDLLRLRARRTLEDAGGVRILERQILDVLRDHAGGGSGVRAVRLHSLDRKSVVSGKSVSVRVDLGVRRIINKKTINECTNSSSYHTHSVISYHTSQALTHRHNTSDRV